MSGPATSSTSDRRALASHDAFPPIGPSPIPATTNGPTEPDASTSR